MSILYFSGEDSATIHELIAIAKSRCPINDNLSNVTQINYSLKKNEGWKV